MRKPYHSIVMCQHCSRGACSSICLWYVSCCNDVVCWWHITLDGVADESRVQSPLQLWPLTLGSLWKKILDGVWFQVKGQLMTIPGGYEKQNLETFELYGLITSVNLTNPILYGPGIPSGSHNPCKGQPKIGRKRILVTLCKETWKYCWKVNYFKSLKNWTPILQLSSQNQIKLSKRGWGYLLPIDTFKKPQQSPLEVHQDDEGPKKGPQVKTFEFQGPKTPD